METLITIMRKEAVIKQNGFSHRTYREDAIQIVMASGLYPESMLASQIKWIDQYDLAVTFRVPSSAVAQI